MVFLLPHAASTCTSVSAGVHSHVQTAHCSSPWPMLCWGKATHCWQVLTVLELRGSWSWCPSPPARTPALETRALSLQEDSELRGVDTSKACTWCVVILTLICYNYVFFLTGTLTSRPFKEAGEQRGRESGPRRTRTRDQVFRSYVMMWIQGNKW